MISGGQPNFLTVSSAPLQKEDRTQSVIVKPFFLFVMKNELALEKILVLQEINL